MRGYPAVGPAVKLDGRGAAGRRCREVDDDADPAAAETGPDQGASRPAGLGHVAGRSLVGAGPVGGKCLCRTNPAVVGVHSAGGEMTSPYASRLCSIFGLWTKLTGENYGMRDAVSDFATSQG